MATQYIRRATSLLHSSETTHFLSLPLAIYYNDEQGGPMLQDKVEF